MKLEDLQVYTKLFNLAVKIHNITLDFPKFELFELGSQLRRSSNSCPANLAEGFGNRHTRIYLESISRAQGELRETGHHLKMAGIRGYLNLEELNKLLIEYEQASKTLFRLTQSLERNIWK